MASSQRERLELRGVRKSYLETCEYMQRVHVGPLLGSRKAIDVDRGDVEAFGRALLKRGLAPKSARNLMGFLHAAFEHGIDGGWVRDNPVRRAEKPGRRRSGANPDLQFLSVTDAPSPAGPGASAIPGRARPGPSRRDSHGGSDGTPPVRAAGSSMARHRLVLTADPSPKHVCPGRAFA
jgi:hypothetical protein